jgi:hypothetical protein
VPYQAIALRGCGRDQHVESLPPAQLRSFDYATISDVILHQFFPGSGQSARKLTVIGRTLYADNAGRRLAPASGPNARWFLSLGSVGG